MKLLKTLPFLVRRDSTLACLMEELIVDRGMLVAIVNSSFA